MTKDSAATPARSQGAQERGAPAGMVPSLGWEEQAGCPWVQLDMTQEPGCVTGEEAKARGRCEAASTHCTWEREPLHVWLQRTPPGSQGASELCCGKDELLAVTTPTMSIKDPQGANIRHGSSRAPQERARLHSTDGQHFSYKSLKTNIPPNSVKAARTVLLSCECAGCVGERLGQKLFLRSSINYDVP